MNSIGFKRVQLKEKYIYRITSTCTCYETCTHLRSDSAILCIASLFLSLSLSYLYNDVRPCPQAESHVPPQAHNSCRQPQRCERALLRKVDSDCSDLATRAETLNGSEQNQKTQADASGDDATAVLAGKAALDIQGGGGSRRKRANVTPV